MADALAILGIRTRQGKISPLLSPQAGSWGQGGWLQSCWSTTSYVPTSPFFLPRLLFPLYLQEIIHLLGKIYLLRRRLSFTLWALVCNKCGSPPSPINCSLLPWGHSSGLCTPGQLLLTGLCTRMPGCWLLLEKQISKQIQQQKFALETSAEVAKALLCAWGKKNQHGFGQNSQTKQILHGKLQFK